MADLESKTDFVPADEAVARNCEIYDGDVMVYRSTFPSGVRDFLLFLRTENAGLRILNPLELLGTNMAVRVLNRIRQSSTQSAIQFGLSRLLVQCLEYRGNTRHMIVEDWSDADLRGQHLFECNRTELARDCSVEQAHQYELVMKGDGSPSLPATNQYWGTFSTLPLVEDMFDDPALGTLAIQLTEIIESQGEAEGNVSVKIGWLRSLINQCWQDNFSGFDLDTGVRKRRLLFKKLMSVAVRQASTMTHRIAYALMINCLDGASRAGFEFSEPEEKLFEIRYGSYPQLGNINIGFLFGYGDLHSELINSLGKGLLSGDSEIYLVAEENLFRHIQLLARLRDRRRDIRAEQRLSTRLNRSQRLPQARVSAEQQIDISSSLPESKMISTENLLLLKQVVDRLKPRDRERVDAIIEAGGDKRAAAELLGIDPDVFMRRYRQSTQQNVKAAFAGLQD